MKKFLAATVSAASIASSAFAADVDTSVAPAPLFTQAKPAVDGVNGKAEFFGGASQAYASNGGSLPYLASSLPYNSSNSTAWYGTAGGAGTISIPVGHSFGIQLDGVSALYENAYTGGGAGHFFWRDPDKGLLGAYGSGLYSALTGGRGVWQAAGEAEAYLHRFTIGGLVGVQGYTNNSHNTFYNALQTPNIALAYGSGFYSATNPNRFFDDVFIAYYPIDDLKLAVGHVYSQGLNGASVQAEYLLSQFRGSGIAVSTFAEGIVGANNNSLAMAGIKIYFGNHDKTLIRRHREDDPATHISEQMEAERVKNTGNITASSSRKQPCHIFGQHNFVDCLK